MFTGIVEEIGEVTKISNPGAASKLNIRAEAIVKELTEGASVAVNGACLTVLNPSGTGFSCDISPETARRTNLGALRPGGRVNLERAMRFSDRINGHLVSGHVEGKGRVCQKKQEENAFILSIEVPVSVLKYCIPKGSIALDGVSMTINTLDTQGITVSVIPHTASATTLGQKNPGDLLNLESDLIGKYIEGLMKAGAFSLPAKP
ncbi:MAG: riboflavin synthase [Nitrospiria bacterium]